MPIKPANPIRAVFAACVFLSLFLSGCWDNRELDEIGIVTGVGIDLNPRKEVAITAQILKPGQLKSGAGGGGGGGSGGDDGLKAVFNVTSEAKTPFSAVRGALFQSSRKWNFTHNELLIIGKAAAVAGTGTLLDFFYRDPEPRPTQWVLVADGKASEIFEAEPGLESFLASDIAHLIVNQGNTSQTAAINLQEFMTCLASKSTSPLAPIVKIITRDGKERAIINGSAVFRNDRWVGELTKKETRGYLWVAGKVKSGIIELEIGKKGQVDVEIIQAQGKYRAELVQKRLRVTVDIKMAGNVGGIATNINLATPEKMKYLEGRICGEIRNEVRAAFKKAALYRSDFFGIGDALYRNTPQEWPQIKAEMDQLLGRMKPKIMVKAKLRLLGEITKPITRQ